MLLDINTVKTEAEKEVREERVKKAKEKIKQLLRKQEDAKIILANIEREISDAYKSIGEGNI